MDFKKLELEYKKLTSTLGRGTTNYGTYLIKTFNEKYVLIHKKGSTGYVGRLSGNSYGATEYMVFSKELLSDFYNSESRKLHVFPGEQALFYKEGEVK